MDKFAHAKLNSVLHHQAKKQKAKDLRRRLASAKLSNDSYNLPTENTIQVGKFLDYEYSKETMRDSVRVRSELEELRDQLSNMLSVDTHERTTQLES